MAAEMAMRSPTAADVAAALDEAGIDGRIHGDGSIAVVGATHDSRRVTAGSMFVCLRGDRFDGHDFAGAAVAAGASALLVDHHLDLDYSVDASGAGRRPVTQIVVADTRVAAGIAAARIANHPSRALQAVGITGTNGKTTTTQLVATILEGAGRSTGVIGTLHGPRTTPEATDLQTTLAGFVQDGRDAAVMEVSSHALALHRVDGTAFDVVAFTNFGHDHLDLHGTPEEYFRAKSRLFDLDFASIAVINVDDPHGRLLADAVAARDDGMRVVEVAPSTLDDVRIGAGEHRYRWAGNDVVVPIGGDFNVANSLVALTIAVELGIDAPTAVAAIAGTSGVPGRFERVESPAAERRGLSVIVDYAHAPDGLERLLEAARDVVSGTGRVIVVFGCGGERDRPKRPRMGEIATRLADRAIITSDNPRREDPDAIIAEVLDGVPSEYRDRTSSNPDRRAAIGEALTAAARGDLVIIAGKGHETTQDLGSTIIEFDDRQVALELLESAGSDPTSQTCEDPT